MDMHHVVLTGSHLEHLAECINTIVKTTEHNLSFTLFKMLGGCFIRTVKGRHKEGWMRQLFERRPLQKVFSFVVFVLFCCTFLPMHMIHCSRMYSKASHKNT